VVNLNRKKRYMKNRVLTNSDSEIFPFSLTYGTRRTRTFWLGSGKKRIEKASTKFRRPGSLARTLVGQGGHGGGPQEYDGVS